jgi:hypothetical protein
MKNRKNRKPVARQIPKKEKICTGADLANALKKVVLPPREAKTWYKEMAAARKALKPQANKWKC